MNVSLKFFAVGGAILIATGLLQLLVRQRRPGEGRVLNRGTLWALFCMLVGGLAVLVGTGVVPVALG